MTVAEKAQCGTQELCFVWDGIEFEGLLRLSWSDCDGWANGCVPASALVRAIVGLI